MKPEVSADIIIATELEYPLPLPREGIETLSLTPLIPIAGLLYHFPERGLKRLVSFPVAVLGFRLLYHFPERGLKL